MNYIKIPHLLILLLMTELLVYSVPFLHVVSEDTLVPTGVDSLKDIRGLDKIHLQSGSSLSLNEGVMIGSELLNGYDPIFSKRLLWIVNAVEGRPTDHVESVSLHARTLYHPVYELAGVTHFLSNTDELTVKEQMNRFFYKVETVSDEFLYSLINAASLEIFTTLYFAESDNLYTRSAQTLPACTGNPEVLLEGLRISARVPCDVYWVAPMSYMEGWVLKGEQFEVSAIPGFRFLQVYRLPAGEYDAYLEYRPAWWRKIWL